MDTANATDDPPPTAAPHTERRSWLVGMLTLLHALVQLGGKLRATVSGSGTATGALRQRFGTDCVALILARIQRALALAQALEDRLLRRVIAIDHATAARLDGRVAATKSVGSTASEPKEPRSAPSLPAWDDATLLERLPTAREIATMLRLKPPEEVMLDICRDLGIGPGSDVWDDIMTVLTVPPRVRAARVRRFEHAPTAAEDAADAADPKPTFGTGPPGMAQAA